MNTIFFTKAMMYLASLSAGVSTNPVKMSVFLIFLAALMFTTGMCVTSVVLIPLIFFLIFVGGILLMFMILSATLPNEKSKKSSMKWKVMVGVTVILAFATTAQGWKSGQEYFVHLKSMVLENQTLLILTGMMVMYFIFCVSIVATEELPLRKVTHCPQKWIL